jgi:hypothetical protein
MIDSTQTLTRLAELSFANRLRVVPPLCEGLSTDAPIEMSPDRHTEGLEPIALPAEIGCFGSGDDFS